MVKKYDLMGKLFYQKDKLSDLLVKLSYLVEKLFDLLVKLCYLNRLKAVFDFSKSDVWKENCFCR